MNRTEIYLKAASRVANGRSEFSCNAIFKIEAPTGQCDYTPSEVAYREMFAPTDDPHRIEDAWGEHWGDDRKERRACRVLALCFAAAMAEAGDL